MLHDFVGNGKDGFRDWPECQASRTSVGLPFSIYSIISLMDAPLFAVTPLHFAFSAFLCKVHGSVDTFAFGCRAERAAFELSKSREDAFNE